jgi:hypothetical protein
MFLKKGDILKHCDVFKIGRPQGAPLHGYSIIKRENMYSTNLRFTGYMCKNGIHKGRPLQGNSITKRKKFVYSKSSV